MNIGIIIQARTGSSRLPKKVLMKLPHNSKITVLQQVIRRVKKLKDINQVIIATTKKEKDDIIVNISRKEKVNYYRGSENNVLKRYYLAAKKFQLDIIIRVTSDCPCIDPEIIKQLLDFHKKSKSDFTSNCITKTFPHGVDAEVFTFSTLESAYQNATLDYEKEHVSEYILKHPKKYKIASYKASKKYYFPDIRITLDTKEDYVLMCLLYDFLQKKPLFLTKDIIQFFKCHPWIKLINQTAPTQYHLEMNINRHHDNNNTQIK